MSVFLREKLSDYAHKTWCGWMEHLFSKCKPNDDGTVTIPADLVLRWKRQVVTKYVDLPEAEKSSDRKEAASILGLLGKDDR